MRRRTEQTSRVLSPARDPGADLFARLAVAGQDEQRARYSSPDALECVQELVDPLLRLETTGEEDDTSVLVHAELSPYRRPSSREEERAIHAVGDEMHALAWHAEANELPRERP